jgi:predicted lipoprotein with Yx(FWY)xxD motif
MKRLPLIATLVVAAGLAIVLAACGGSSSSGNSSPSSTSGATTANAASIGLRSTPLGHVLVDRGNGRTLYLFEADKNGRSACSGACLSLWPPLTTGSAPKLAAGLGAKAGTIPAKGGKQQVTYAGHPLYLYAGDQKAGQTTGQDINSFGASWYVLGANGVKIGD